MALKVKGYPGVAWRKCDDEWEPEEYEMAWFDEEGNKFFETLETHNPNEGKICCVMVGGDRLFYFDPDEVEELNDDEFCPECGQIGCSWGNV